TSSLTSPERFYSQKVAGTIFDDAQAEEEYSSLIHTLVYSTLLTVNLFTESINIMTRDPTGQTYTQ
ncbi:hypothetical protein KIL84_010870, partial [Mauremys mutica]